MSDIENIFQVRVPEESSQIAEKSAGANVVIVGTSFIGLETASQLIGSAKSVTAIGMEDLPLERVLGYFLEPSVLKLWI